MPNSNPNQNGKNPGWGCPTDQPDPTDLACTTMATANAMNPSAVRISARRIGVPRDRYRLLMGLSKPPLVIRSRCSALASSSHFRNDDPVMNCPFKQLSTIYFCQSEYC